MAVNQNDADLGLAPDLELRLGQHAPPPLLGEEGLVVVPVLGEEVGEIVGDGEEVAGGVDLTFRLWPLLPDEEVRDEFALGPVNIDDQAEAGFGAPVLGLGFEEGVFDAPPHFIDFLGGDNVLGLAPEVADLNDELGPENEVDLNDELGLQVENDVDLDLRLGPPPILGEEGGVAVPVLGEEGVGVEIVGDGEELMGEMDLGWRLWPLLPDEEVGDELALGLDEVGFRVPVLGFEEEGEIDAPPRSFIITIPPPPNMYRFIITKRLQSSDLNILQISKRIAENQFLTQHQAIPFTTIIVDANGRSWPVNIEADNTYLQFKNGWEDMVLENGYAVDSKLDIYGFYRGDSSRAFLIVPCPEE